MHVTPGVLFLGMIDELVHVALQGPITARRVRVEPTARVHGEVSRLLDRLDGEIAGRLDDDCPLATDPGNNCRAVFLVMPPAWLALLAPPPRAASQRLLPAVFRLA